MLYSPIVVNLVTFEVVFFSDVRTCIYRISYITITCWGFILIWRDLLWSVRRMTAGTASAGHVTAGALLTSRKCVSLTPDCSRVLKPPSSQIDRPSTAPFSLLPVSSAISLLTYLQLLRWTLQLKLNMPLIVWLVVQNETTHFLEVFDKTDVIVVRVRLDWGWRGLVHPTPNILIFLFSFNAN